MARKKKPTGEKIVEKTQGNGSAEQPGKTCVYCQGELNERGTHCKSCRRVQG